MDFNVAIATDGSASGQMTFGPPPANTGNLSNNVWLSLMINQGSFFQNPDFGSRLYLLRREKNTLQTASLAAEYVKEALQWLLDSGRAKALDVATEKDAQNNGRLNAVIQVTKADGTTVTFKIFTGVV